MNRIISRVLTSLLSEYIEPIHGYQLGVAIWQGNVQLQNVSIKSTAFFNHNIPIKVTSGVIKSVSLHFPWTSIKSESCQIDIDGLYILGSLDTSMIKSKQDKDNVLDELEKAFKESNTNGNSFWSGISTAIVDNIICKIKNAHIRVEYLHNDSFFAGGILLKNFEIFTVDNNGEKIFVNNLDSMDVHQKLVVNGLNVYLDIDTVPYNLEMLENDEQEHKNIIHDFSFDSFFEKNQKDKNMNKEMKINIQNIAFSISHKQYIGLVEFQKQQRMFKLRQKYSACGKPDKLPKGKNSLIQWWNYIHKCATEARFPNRINIKKLITLLKYRNVYFQFWKMKKELSFDEFKNSQYYLPFKSIENTLDLEIILKLRSYSEFKFKNEQKQSRFDINDINAIANLSNDSYEKKSLTIFFNFLHTKINLFNNEQEDSLFNVNMDELNGTFQTSYENSTSSFKCSSLKIYSDNDVIFEKDKNNETDAFSITFTNSLKEQYLSIIIYSSMFVFDSSLFQKFNDFCFHKNNDAKYYEKDYNKKRNSFLKISILILNQKLMINKSSVSLSLDSLKLLNQKQYLDYELSLNNLNIFVEKSNICSQNYLVANLYKDNETDELKLKLNIPEFSLTMNKLQYQELMGLQNKLLMNNNIKNNNIKNNDNNTKYNFQISSEICKLSINIINSNFQKNQLLLCNLLFSYNQKNTIIKTSELYFIKEKENLIKMNQNNFEFISMNDEIYFNFNTKEPQIQIEVDIIEQIIKFFENDNQDEESNPSLSKKKVKFHINLVNPRIAFILPAIKKPLNLNFDFSEIDFNISKIVFTNFLIKVNNREITNRTNMEYLLNSNGSNFLQINPIIITFSTKYYLILLESISYLLKKYNNIFNKKEKGETNKSNFIVSSPNIIILLNNVIKIECNKMNYKFSNEENILLFDLICIEDLLNLQKITSISSFKMTQKSYDYFIELSDKNLLKFNLFEDSTNLIYRFFMKKNKKYINCHYETNKIPIKIKIYINKFSAALLNKNNNFGLLLSENALIYMKVHPLNHHFHIELNHPRILTNKYSSNILFDTCEDTILSFTLKDDKMKLSVDNMVLSYYYLHLIELIQYFKNMILIEDVIENSPLEMKLYKYDINIKKLNVNLQYYEDEKSTGIYAHINNFVLQNLYETNKLNIKADNISIYDRNELNFSNLDCLEILLNFKVNNSLPPLNEGFDKSLLEKFKEFKDKNYLHSIETSVLISNLYYTHLKEPNIQLLKSLQFLFDKTEHKSPFITKSILNIQVNKAIIKFPSFSDIVISGLKYYIIDKTQEIFINNIIVDKYPNFLFSNDEILYLKIEKGKIDIKLNGILLHFKYDIILKLINLFLNSEFISFPYSPKKEAKSILYLEIVNNKILFKHKGSIFYLNINGSITKNEEKIKFKMNNLESKFFNQNNNNFYPYIFQDLGFKCSISEKNVNFSSDNLELKISPKDIFFFNSLFKFYYPKVLNFFNKNSNNKQSNISLKTKSITITLYEDNRSNKNGIPFVRFSLQKFLYNSIKNKIIMNDIAVDSFNQDTNFWDLVLEPFSTSAQIFQNSNKFIINNSKLDEIKLSLSHKFITKLINFNMNINDIVYQDTKNEPEAILENNTGKKIQIELSNSKQFTILNNGKLLFSQFKNFILKNELGNFEVTLSDLLYPKYLSPFLCISSNLRNQTRFIYLSSFLIFNNETSNEFQIFNNENQSFELKKNTIMGCPYDYNNFQQFSIEKSSKIIKLSSIKNKACEYFVKEKSLNCIIYQKFIPERGINCITISSLMVIHNLLEISIEITIKNIPTKYIIHPNESEKIYSKKELYFIVKIKSNLSSETKIYLENEKLYPINFKNNTLALKINFDNNQYHCYIFSPLIIYNSTFQPLLVTVKNSPRKYKIKPSSSKIVGDLPYFNDRSDMSIMIELNSFKSDYLDSFVSHMNSILLLKSTDVNGLFFPITYLSSYTGIKTRTSILKFSYFLTLKNSTSHSLYLKPISETNNEFLFYFKPNDMNPLSISTQDFTYYLSLQQEFKEKIKISFGYSFHTTLRVNHILIEVNVQSKENCIFIELLDAIFPQPIMVSNNFIEPIYIHQENDTLIVNKMSTTIISFNNIEKSTEIIFEAKNILFTFTLTNLYTPIKYINSKNEVFFIEMKILENGYKCIFISSDLIENKENIEIEFCFNIPQFIISLIDNNIQELAILSLQKINLDFHRSNELDTFILSIDHIQIDDENFLSPIPIVLFNNTMPFLSLNTVTLSRAPLFRIFESFYLRISDITIYLDITFLNDLLQFVKSLKPQSTDYSHNYNSKIESFYFNSFRLDQFNFDITIKSQTGRPMTQPNDPLLSRFIPSITNAILSISNQQFSHLFATSDYMKDVIFHQIKTMVLAQIFNIIGRTDALSVLGVFPGVFQNIQSIFSGNIDQYHQLIIPATEGLLRSTSNLFRKGTFEENEIHSFGVNRTAIQTIGDGFTSLSNNVISGITGILTKPINECKRDGPKGIFTGLAKSAIGVVAHPISGILDASAGVIGGIRKFVSGNIVIEQIRLPRVFLLNHIIPYNYQISTAQIELQKRKYFNEQILIFINQIAEEPSFAITQNYICFFENSGYLKIIYEIKQILSVSVTDKTIILKMKNKKLYIHCPTNEDALNCSKVLYSQIIYQSFYK